VPDAEWRAGLLPKCREDFELLGQRQSRIEGVPHLSLAHPGDHFDPA
jgi:hypothetical protein